MAQDRGPQDPAPRRPAGCLTGAHATLFFAARVVPQPPTRSPTHATTHQILDQPANQPTAATASAESRPLSDAEDVRTGEGRQSGPCALICAVARCWHVALRDAVQECVHARWSYPGIPPAASRQVALAVAKFARLRILDWTLVSSRVVRWKCPPSGTEESGVHTGPSASLCPLPSGSAC